MKSKKIIIAIIMVLVIMIIITATILMLIYKENNKTEDQYYADPEEEEFEVEIDTTMQKESVRSNYYIVKNCIMKFYTYYSGIYNEQYNTLTPEEIERYDIKEIKSKNVKSLYNILDKKYIEYKGLTTENLETKMAGMDYVKLSNLKLLIDDMYVIRKNENINTYFVEGIIVNVSTSKKSNFSMIVILDRANYTFSLILGDYIEQNKIEFNTDFNLQVQDSIEDQIYNTFKYQEIEDDTYVVDLFEDYKYNLLYNPGKVYEDLDEEYKEKRFSTTDKFKEYINNHRDYIQDMNISKYLKNKLDDYTQYICLDENGKYLFINEFATMDYKLILDNHTIDTKEFIEKYDKSNNQVKVGMNAEKVIDAINDMDYEYVYSKLDETFRKNNYATLDEFKQYMKNNFYQNNMVEYTEFAEESNTYIYKATVRDADENYSEEKNMTIIMQLLEDRDFVMSFSIE